MLPVLSEEILQTDDQNRNDVHRPDDSGGVAKAEIVKDQQIGVEGQKKGGIAGAAFTDDEGGDEVGLQTEDGIAGREQQQPRQEQGQSDVAKAG